MILYACLCLRLNLTPQNTQRLRLQLLDAPLVRQLKHLLLTSPFPKLRTICQLTKLLKLVIAICMTGWFLLVCQLCNSSGLVISTVGLDRNNRTGSDRHKKSDCDPLVKAIEHLFAPRPIYSSHCLSKSFFLSYPLKLSY